MKIVFDPAKDHTNTEKHGVSLAHAGHFEWDTAVVWPDERRQYGEQRQCAIGYVGVRLFVVAFADLDGSRRIISLRKANKREERTYAEA
jgi:hypothetical protein